nr:hypothetical protein [Acinetobacter baumannii]
MLALKLALQKTGVLANHMEGKSGLGSLSSSVLVQHAPGGTVANSRW